MRRLQTGSCNLFSWRITNCRVSVAVSMSAGQPLACTVGSVISYTGEAHRVTVFLLRIQTRRLRVTSVTIGPEWHASTSHHRRGTVSVIILLTCHCAFVPSGIFRLHACLETLYSVRDDTDWTSRLYFADDYKLLVRILRPSGPICICVGSLFVAVMFTSVQEC